MSDAGMPSDVEADRCTCPACTSPFIATPCRRSREIDAAPERGLYVGLRRGPVQDEMRMTAGGVDAAAQIEIEGRGIGPAAGGPRSRSLGQG